MITANDIKMLYRKEVDIDKTERLKAKLGRMRSKRKRLYLTRSEFERILEWKLGQQVGRQRDLRKANTEAIIKSVTGLALTITHPDPDYQLELRIDILCALRGVAVPIASAVLALVYPEEYAVIDYRNWRQIFDETKDVFSTADYKRYMTKIRELASELGWQVQEVDHAIWKYDRRKTQE